MTDNNQTLEWQLIFKGVQDAIKDMRQLGDELDKFKNKKLVGSLSDQLKTELNLAKDITNQQGQRINEILGNIGKNSGTGITKYVDGYKQQINSMMMDIQKYNRLFNETGDIGYQQKMQALIPQVRQLTAEHEALNNSLGLNVKNANLLSTTYEKIKEHASWMLSASLIGGAIALPVESVKTMADVEQQMAGMLQTLPELYKDYPNHIKDQEALNNLTKEFIGIGEQYGQEVDKIIEAGKLWSRGYKDVNTVLALTHNTSKLAIADMMDLNTANTGVESVISAYRRQGDAVNFSNHIVDAWTNVAHNAQSSATDLAEALKRSSAAANVVGVSFDFVNAMASVMIKNTGQSGSVVGNALKSIFASIHSEKGIAELQKLGVAIYEFDSDGTKHFRNVENVLTDLMIKTQGTSQNLEDVMQKVAGGKFQWSKSSSLFSDYNEFIRVYNLSINSTGVAEKQVMAQMDTLVRKAEQVKASLTGVIMGTSEAGLSSYLKAWLDSINNMLKGLQQINPMVYTVMGTMAKWGAILYTAKVALDFLDRSIIACTTAKAALTTSTEVNAVAEGVNIVATNAEASAMSRLGVATTVATGGLNLIVAALVAAGTGAALYASNVGEAVNAMDQQKQRQQDLLAVKQQELDMNAKQTEFIGTLSNSYVEFQGKLNAAAGDEEKATEIKKSMGVTIQELTKLIGEEGVARLQQSNFSQEAIKAEQSTHSQAAIAMRTDIANIKTAMDNYTDRQIEATQARIDSLYKETEALSIWQKATIAAFDFYSGLMEKQISFKETLLNNMPSFMGSERMQLAQSIDSDKEYRESLRSKSVASVNDSIEEAKAQLAKLQLEKYQRDTGDNFTPTTIGGSEVDSDNGKNKRKRGSNGSSYEPTDHTQEEYRLGVGRDTERMFQQAKVSADQYSQSLELLNTKESIFGFSTDNANEKIKLMNSRILELIGQSMEYTSVANDYDQQVNNMVASNGTLVKSLDDQKASWKDLTKEQKENLIQQNRQDIQQQHTITTLIDLSDKLRVQAQEAAKAATGISTEATKLQIKTPEDRYNQNMKNIDLNKNIARSSLGYNPSDDQKRLVELRFAIEELAEAQKRLNEIENEPLKSDNPDELNKRTEDIKKQQVAVNDLKNSVDKLANTNLDKINHDFADMVSEWATEGKSFKDIWKELWKEFAQDAIYALMGVEHQQGFLSKLFGSIFGGGSSSGGAPAAQSSVSASTAASFFPSTAWKFADGGVVDKPTYGVFGEGGKEANINLDKLKSGDKRQSSLLSYANSFSDKGTDIYPYFNNPKLANGSMSINVNTDSSRTNAILEEQTNHVKMQTQMMSQMAESGNGNVTVIHTQVSDKDVLDILSRNPSALQQITSRNNSFGYK